MFAVAGYNAVVCDPFIIISSSTQKEITSQTDYYFVSLTNYSISLTNYFFQCSSSIILLNIFVIFAVFLGLCMSVAGVLYLYVYQSGAYLFLRAVVPRLSRNEQEFQEKARSVYNPQEFTSSSETVTTANLNKHSEKIQPKRVLFYNPATFQRVRDIKKSSYFEDCEESNCEMTFDSGHDVLSTVDAVIYDFRRMTVLPNYTRPKSQVWIHIQHEAAVKHRKQIKMNNKVNWTMTHSRHSDIHLPYGMIMPKIRDRQLNRDYLGIAKNKSVDAIWVVSHCHTRSRREKYADILKQYIDIDILGACGRRWQCGRRFNHDIHDCFSILNSTYRYYLAFENTLCTDYITEKFFENYDYDILQIVRGGDLKTRPINISKEAYISTSDFKDAHALGKYLQSLSQDTNQYANKLKIKDKYRLIHYREVFKKSMCEICKRLHNLEEYHSVYKNMAEWFTTNQPCFKPDDIPHDDKQNSTKQDSIRTKEM